MPLVLVLVENNGRLGSTLLENGPRLFENSQRISPLDQINENHKDPEIEKLKHPLS
jgi:hypothetical protein